MTNKKWSNPKGKKTITVEKHTRRVDITDSWGRFLYSKHIDVKKHERKKPKKKIHPIVMKKVLESSK